MTGDDDKPRIADNGSRTDNLFVVFRTIGDTTWRMFGPVIVGAVVGWWLDTSAYTTHGMLIGSIIGLVLAGLLVWRQYKEVTEAKK
jgi:hypothetical protein